MDTEQRMYPEGAGETGDSLRATQKLSVTRKDSITTNTYASYYPHVDQRLRPLYPKWDITLRTDRDHRFADPNRKDYVK